MSTKEYETGRIKLKLRSGNYFTNYINRITPPEYLVMRNLHGPNALELIEIQGTAIETKVSETGKRMKRNVSRKELLSKLNLKYGVIRIDKVFPGESPTLPFTFEDIEVTSNKGVEEKMSEVIDGEESEEWEEVEDEKVEAKKPAKEAEKVEAKKPAKENKDDFVGKTPKTASL